jgi:hypothetical protein
MHTYTLENHVYLNGQWICVYLNTRKLWVVTLEVVVNYILWMDKEL